MPEELKTNLKNKTKTSFSAFLLIILDVWDINWLILSSSLLLYHFKHQKNTMDLNPANNLIPSQI